MRHGLLQAPHALRPISASPHVQTPILVLTSLWELNLQSTGDPVSRGSYLSPLGQELAPWQLHQVAVASAGLSPQPLWISAAGYSSNESIKIGRASCRERV